MEYMNKIKKNFADSTTMDKIFKHTDVKVTPNSSSLMQAMEYPVIEDEDLMDDIRPKYLKTNPIVTVQAPFQSLSLHSDGGSFQLIDNEETIKVSSPDDLVHLLNCPDDCKMRVVSIFGNIGDGKSHTLNDVFFRGKEVFKTSSSSENSTRGVWAAWQPSMKVLCLDTPPLNYPNSNMTYFLKIIALSDVIIYRTRAEKLPADMFKFLGEASYAYQKHFQSLLHKLDFGVSMEGSLCGRGPAIIINHEPRHSPPLKSEKGFGTPEEQILNQIKNLNLDLNALGQLYYSATLPCNTSYVSNSNLPNILQQHLDKNSVRIPRRINTFMNILVAVSQRFQGRLVCEAECKCCQARCINSMGHTLDGTKHFSESKCKFQIQFENKIFVCQGCRGKVKEVNPSGAEESIMGIARSAWNGYELHCPRCGPIYKSRQYWYGNKSPEEYAVFTKIIHIWPGSANTISPGNVGVRKAMEGIGSLTGTLTSCWLADAIAPAYWQPTSKIMNCNVCKCKLEAGRGEIHHCRWCGMGVCGPCSATRRPVPHRGWTQPVRVCDVCTNNNVERYDAGDVTVRKVGEAVAGALSPITAALQCPKGFLKDIARPAYWTPDEQAPACALCSVIFGSGPDCSIRHHCRKCGQSICATCSPHRQAVPERGWTSSVRVCNACYNEKNN